MIILPLWSILAREVALGRSLSLSNTEASILPELSSSQIAVIPKSNWPNKWRLIVHLFSPKGASVNDGIVMVHSAHSLMPLFQM